MANEKDPATTATPEGTTDQPQPKFMTAEDFNGAMTARERRFEQRLEKLIESHFAKRASEQPAPEEKAPEAGAQSSPDSAEIKRAAAKIEALQKQMAAEKEATAKEKAEMLQKQERAEVISALAAAGVTTAKGAYATLKDDGRIRRNADGELVMVVVKDYAGTKVDEEVPLAVGLKDWLATDEGKCFLPPRGGGDGSGTVIRGNGTRTGAPLSKEEAKREAQRTLTSFVLGNR